MIEELGPQEPKPILEGDERTFRVWLDTNQYRDDMMHMVDGAEVNSECRLASCHDFPYRIRINHSI